MKNKQFTARFAAVFIAVILAVIGMTGCGNNQESEAPTEDTSYLVAYEQYVESVLDANYHAEYASYISMTGATEDQASSVHRQHVLDLARLLADWYDIKLDQLPAEIGNQLTDICEILYKKADYSVSDVQKSGDAVFVSVEIKPIDFLADAADDVMDYTGKFNDRAKAGEFEYMTESEYENEYAKGLLTVLESVAKNVVYAEQKSYRIEIMYDTETGVSYISEEDLSAINQMIFAE
ncbi:MAG: hypothetical protein IJZ85_03980 [Lachnospiraceae bacterium]|nr:hypothetical protein [Lachnospiraceae bacterium]